MARYLLVGYCNAAEGRDEEFNEWYWNHHFRDLLDLPGVISGHRFTPAGAQLGGVAPPYNYLGVFEIECEQPQAFIDELMARSASGQIARSDSVEPGSSLVLWQLMTRE